MSGATVSNLAFVAMLGSFEFLAATLVERIDNRGRCTRFVAKNGEPVREDALINRIAVRTQKTLIFTAAALIAIGVNQVVQMGVKVFR